MGNDGKILFSLFKFPKVIVNLSFYFSSSNKDSMFSFNYKNTGETNDPSLQMTDPFTCAEWVKIPTNFLLSNSAMIFHMCKELQSSRLGNTTG